MAAGKGKKIMGQEQHKDQVGCQIDPPLEKVKIEQIKIIAIQDDEEEGMDLMPNVIQLEEVKDKRIFVSLQFVFDDEFIKKSKFMRFWLKANLKQLLDEETTNFD